MASTSPFRRHQQQVHAAIIAGTALGVANVLPDPAASDSAAATEYRQLLDALGNDLRSLSDIQSIERKVETKRQLIDRYRDWVTGALVAGKDGPDGTAGTVAQDEIVVTILIWALDVHDWGFALQIAVHVLSNGLSLPERYKRTPGTLIAEQIADTALADVDAVDHGTLIAAQQITAGEDMPDEVRAKLMKALGRNFKHQAETAGDREDDAIEVAGGIAALWAAARDALTRALALNQHCGVKKDIEAVERALAKLTPRNRSRTNIRNAPRRCGGG